MKIDIDKYMTINVTKLFVIEKKQIAYFLFLLAIFIVFFGSMNVWFTLPLSNYYPVLGFILAMSSYSISRTIQTPIFNANNYWLPPVIAYILISFYQAANNGLNINAYIKALFSALTLYFIFCSNSEIIEKLMRDIARFLGGVLLVSYPFFFLYIIGFPLPHIEMDFNDGFYYFSNYFLFLIDDRTIFAFIPRFQSIFLEPTYLGSTCAIILMTQRGKWKKWYNISILVGLLISFSLAGYAYLMAIIFLNLWTSRKKIFAKAMAVILFISFTIGGAFVYNDGDNMLHNLILLRLEVEDGDIAGNNRVTEKFDTEYDGYLQSSDIIFGRDYDYSQSGDSGYKVFFYDFGLIGVILLFAFYIIAFAKYKDFRSFVAALIVMLLIFGVDAFVLWFGRFLPLYAAAMRPIPTIQELKDEKNEKDHSN